MGRARWTWPSKNLPALDAQLAAIERAAQRLSVDDVTWSVFAALAAEQDRPAPVAAAVPRGVRPFALTRPPR
ncbi:MAG: hypothetical protein JO130_01620 [Solirubrobacterales bacterium]|nr:hypothetical protein [Solirubrobacterales bacterium]